jgi:N-acetyl-anhydromuramyl-L-alanine amidase AmpD
MHVNVARAVAAVAVCWIVAGCAATHRADKPGARLERKGDEIVIAGQFFHTGAPVVLWTDPGGYDAYRVERRFAPWAVASFEETAKEAAENRRLKKRGTEVDSPARYGLRFAPTTRSTTRSAATQAIPDSTTEPATRYASRTGRRSGRPTEGGEKLTPEQLQQVRGGGWPLELVQQKVDQFVYHYDVAASSRGCFNTLHDNRGLSVHFMLDLDGTIYQTLDVKERAWHASESNSRSVGIEICNIGAYNLKQKETLQTYYRTDENGKTRYVFPAWAKDSQRTPNFVARPIRNEMVVAQVQGNTYHQYDLTPEQYDSLIKLTAALCTVLPRMTPDYPRDANGNLITRVLDDTQWEQFSGLMGHYHVQENKQDPGPAFQWDKVINGARKRMGLKPLPEGDVINNPKQAVATK